MDIDPKLRTRESHSSEKPTHMIPGIDWRNLLFLISLFPILHLILYFTLSFGCLSFSYLYCQSFY